jgi:hypothetical protein
MSSQPRLFCGLIFVAPLSVFLNRAGTKVRTEQLVSNRSLEASLGMPVWDKLRWELRP